MYKGEPLVKGKQVTSRKRRAAGMLLPEETVALSDRARAVRIKLRDSGSDYMQEALTHEEQTSP